MKRLIEITMAMAAFTALYAWLLAHDKFSDAEESYQQFLKKHVWKN